MALLSTTTVFLLLLVLELLYLKIADRFNIIDKPNIRSSHTHNTIRGGGIIFPICLIIYTLFFQQQYISFFIGAIIISCISFIDDLRSVNNRIRIFFHLLAVLLLFLQVGIFNQAILYILVALIVTIGAINAINFMDGINGITAAYAFVGLTTLLYINVYVVNFTDKDFILTIILAVLVFGFFNFRMRAICFAGDVGSVSIAFIMVFFIIQLIIVSANLSFLMLLLLYGLDASTTIFFRLIRGENIFQPHRSHFYQYLSNEKNIPHIYVATAYACTQLVINALVIFLVKDSAILMGCIIALSLLFFLGLRFCTEGSAKLLN